MLSRRTYAERKARHVCPTHPDVPVHDRVYCDTCRTGMAMYYRAREGETLHAPHIPGPALMCCGSWHPIVALPWIAPCCGHTYFAEETPA